MNTIGGPEKEMEVLGELMKAKSPDLLAVYGRRPGTQL